LTATFSTKEFSLALKKEMTDRHEIDISKNRNGIFLPLMKKGSIYVGGIDTERSKIKRNVILEMKLQR
jgi:hypothetical protein